MIHDTMPHQELTPQQGHDALAQDPELKVLDVRTEPEYRSHRIAGAFLIPIQELQARLGELDPAASYLVTCEHGPRSSSACQFLSQIGFNDLRDLVGGMAEWISGGLPTVSG